jgi:NTP pyrophosphatase (non-canonical NTP hydrolase)
MHTGQARTKDLSPPELAANFRAELADVLCQVVLLARHHEVDLPAEIDRKWLSRLR